MEGFIITLFTDKIFLSGVIAAFLAQLIKMFLHIIHKGKGRLWHKMIESGGMPSSHSALMSALTVSLFIAAGISPLSIAVLFVTFIIMVDAAGLRYSAGQQAVVLNKIIESLKKEKMVRVRHIKEIMGHTPTQVLVGCLLGVAAASVIHFGI